MRKNPALIPFAITLRKIKSIQFNSAMKRKIEASIDIAMSSLPISGNGRRKDTGYDRTFAKMM